MILGKVRRGFFQELVLQSQFPRLAFKLPNPGPLVHRQRRLLAGVLSPVGINPVAKRAWIDTKLLGHLSDRTRGLNHLLHGFFPILRREVSLRTRQSLPFPDNPILVGSLSGSFGAPHDGMRAPSTLGTFLRAFTHGP